MCATGVQMGTTSDGRTARRRAKINNEASMELTAWANALHVTEQELTDALAKVGNDARAVITYVLKHTGSPDRRTTPRS